MTAQLEHRIGLRFPRSQARTLANIAERLRAAAQGTAGGAAMTLREASGIASKAADDARTGEPFIVVCHDPVEAVLMAEWFVSAGAARPAIEQLGRPTPRT